MPTAARAHGYPRATQCVAWAPARKQERAKGFVGFPTLQKGTLILCVLLLNAPGISTLSFTPIPDGVLISSQEDVYREQAFAEVYIVVEQHRNFSTGTHYGELFHLAFARMERLIRDQETNSTMQSLMVHRLDMMRTHFGHTRRQKRGLFDFVGEISNSLFGT